MQEIRYKTLVYSAVTGVMFAGIYPSMAMSDSCPSLRGASVGDPTFNEQLASFSYESKIYPISIFSAFAKQHSPNASNPNFCFRYEAENKAPDVIEKFYWPLAGFQMDTIKPHQRPSIQITKPPGVDPSMEETWIYAFLNSATRTYAFQRRAESRPTYSLVPVALKTDDGRRNSVVKATSIGAKQRYMQIAATEAVEQRFDLKERATFPEVGSDFSSGDGDDIVSTSLASWNGESSEIQVRLGRSSEKTLVFAPIASAMSKASDISELLFLIREFTSKPRRLPFTKDNSFEVQRKIIPKDYGSSQSLYVVEQPIALQTPSGTICFSSPIYSPIPIPAVFLQCRLF